MLKNPSDFPATKFALNQYHKATLYNSSCDPNFHDIFVSDHCNANLDSWTDLGRDYTKNISLDGRTVLTRSHNLKVKEIKVFEITD
jgi:hypothetical protein